MAYVEDRFGSPENDTRIRSSTSIHATSASAGVIDNTPVYRLPDELVAVVFRLLDTRTLLVSVPAVCQRWRVVVGSLRDFRFDGCALIGLRKSTRLENALETTEAQAVLTRLIARVSHVTCLDLSHCVRNVHHALTTAVSECPNLTELVCRRCNMTCDAVVASVPKLPHLEVVIFDDLRSCQLDDDVARALAAHCPKLRVARFSDSSVSHDGLAALIRGCPHLVEASFSSGWNSVSAAVFDGLDIGLTAFELSSCQSTDLAVVLRHFPLLERVTLSCCYEINDAVLETLGGLGARLTEVRIRCGHNLTDGGVAALAERCPRLVVADFDWCDQLTDESLLTLASSCPELRRVNFERTRITDIGVGALGRNCPRLREAMLDAGRGGITDEAALALIYGCPKLERLSMQGARVTDVTLDALSDCPTLRWVCFTDCHFVTLRGITALVKGCPQLELCDIGPGCSITLTEHGGVFTEEAKKAIATKYFFNQLQSVGLLVGLFSNLELWTFRRIFSIELALFSLCFAMDNGVLILLFVAVVNGLLFSEEAILEAAIDTCDISPWVDIDLVCAAALHEPN